MDESGNDVLSAALGYESIGWSVLPLCPHNHVGVGKSHYRSCDSPGKRPFNPLTGSGEWKEFQSRRASADEIRGYWSRHPGLNVGVAFGPASGGLVGVDVDSAEGEELLATLSGGDLPETWEYTTGKGRRLLYVAPPGRDVVIHQFTGEAGREVLRLMGVGSQAVLPPSVHPDTKRPYEWRAGHSPGEMPCAAAPAWMLGRGEERKPAAAVGDDELVGEGGRNNFLTRVAGAMRRVGVDQSAISVALRDINDRRLDPPLSIAEVESIARSVAKYAPANEPGVEFRTPGGVSGWVFKWASQLSDYAPEAEWLWKGYIPRGGITLLSALWKVGKTTLLSSLVRAMGSGGQFLGLDLAPGKVLYVTEEMEKHWSRRRTEMGIGDWAAFHVQPFPVKPGAGDWAAFIDQIVKDTAANNFDLVVFDTLSDLWPVQKENDAGEVQAALAPLRRVTKAGAALLLVHHLRKSGGAEFTGSRGSGVICSFPDIIVNMERENPGDEDDNRRKLTSKGRYEETPRKLVLAWAKESGFAVQREAAAPTVRPADSATARRRRRVLNVLPADPAASMTKYAIHKAMVERFGVGLGETGRQDSYLLELINAGDILRDGESDHRVYHRVKDAPELQPGDDVREAATVLPSGSSDPRGVSGEGS